MDRRNLELNLSTRYIWIAFLCLGLSACTRPPAETPPDAAEMLLKIPAADAAKYNNPPNRGWRNPYLIVRADRVDLLTSATPNEEQQLKAEDVLEVLAHLSASEWPYGRIVAVVVKEGPEVSEQDKIAVRRNRGIVAGELKSAQVEIQWIDPSHL